MTNSYDYVIVGGGTAGSVLANRLSEDPDTSVCLIEGGPSDVGQERVLQLRQWLRMLNSDLDYGYTTVEQPHGNSHIVHSRARVLGGCSSHNTLISFRPFAHDLADWQAAGAQGWDNATVQSYADRIKCAIAPVHPRHRNPLVTDWITASAAATGAEIIDDFNARTSHGGGFADGVGYLPVAYDPHTGQRSSASVAYLHPILGQRRNLTLRTTTWAQQLLFDHDTTTARGVRIRDSHGQVEHVYARDEVVVCAGAIDSPRLLLLSGIGPTDDLDSVGIPTRLDLPGVGENLLDHPESIIMWETTADIPDQTVMYSDGGLFLRRDTSDPRPDLMFHIYQVPFDEHTARMGYPSPRQGRAICMTPNIPRAQSRGKLWLTSADPTQQPALDFRYFTDPHGHDARTLVDGIKIAREIATTEPFASWISHEVAPGPTITTDEQLSEFARRAAHTVYHPAGTCRMGAPSDTTAVVDPHLRVRGTRGLRVVDASTFPNLPTPNPMVTVLAVAERAADLIRTDHT